MMILKLTPFLALAASMYAQTAVPTNQIVAPVAAKPTVMVALPNGSISMAVLGAGIVLDTTTSPPTLVVKVDIAPPAQVNLIHRPLTLAVDANTNAKTITVAGLILLMRNGLVLIEGENADFVKTPTGVKIAKQPTLPSDQWSCLCN
jgi:hypothetical protein